MSNDMDWNEMTYDEQRALLGLPNVRTELGKWAQPELFVNPRSAYELTFDLRRPTLILDLPPIRDRRDHRQPTGSSVFDGLIKLARELADGAQ